MQYFDRLLELKSRFIDNLNKEKINSNKEFTLLTNTNQIDFYRKYIVFKLSKATKEIIEIYLIVNTDGIDNNVTTRLVPIGLDLSFLAPGSCWLDTSSEFIAFSRSIPLSKVVFYYNSLPKFDEYTGDEIIFYMAKLSRNLIDTNTALRKNESNCTVLYVDLLIHKTNLFDQYRKIVFNRYNLFNYDFNNGVIIVDNADNIFVLIRSDNMLILIPEEDFINEVIDTEAVILYINKENFGLDSDDDTKFYCYMDDRGHILTQGKNNE